MVSALSPRMTLRAMMRYADRHHRPLNLQTSGCTSGYCPCGAARLVSSLTSKGYQMHAKSINAGHFSSHQRHIEVRNRVHPTPCVCSHSSTLTYIQLLPRFQQSKAASRLLPTPSVSSKFGHASPYRLLAGSVSKCPRRSQLSPEAACGVLSRTRPSTHIETEHGLF